MDLRLLRLHTVIIAGSYALDDPVTAVSATLPPAAVAPPVSLAPPPPTGYDLRLAFGLCLSSVRYHWTSVVPRRRFDVRPLKAACERSRLWPVMFREMPSTAGASQSQGRSLGGRLRHVLVARTYESFSSCGRGKSQSKRLKEEEKGGKRAWYIVIHVPQSDETELESPYC